MRGHKIINMHSTCTGKDHLFKAAIPRLSIQIRIRVRKNLMQTTFLLDITLNCQHNSIINNRII